MHIRAALFAIATAALYAESAVAHHSFAASFDLTKKVTITGTLTKMDWRNPHIEVFFDVQDGDQPGIWRIEGMPPTFYRDRNLTKADFEGGLGKVFIVTVSRARDGSAHGLMERLTFPDGRTVIVIGQSPSAPATP